MLSPRPAERLSCTSRSRGTVRRAPGEVQFSGDDDEDGDGRWARSAAYNFLCTVTPGVHTFKAQFRSLDGGLVFIHKSSLFVHHR